LFKDEAEARHCEFQNPVFETSDDVMTVEESDSEDETPQLVFSKYFSKHQDTKTN